MPRHGTARSRRDRGHHKPNVTKDLGDLDRARARVWPLEVKASSDHVLDVLVAHPHMLRDLVSDARPSLSHHVDEALDSCEGQEGELA